MTRAFLTRSSWPAADHIEADQRDPAFLPLAFSPRYALLYSFYVPFSYLPRNIKKLSWHLITLSFWPFWPFWSVWSAWSFILRSRRRQRRGRRSRRRRSRRSCGWSRRRRRRPWCRPQIHRRASRSISSRITFNRIQVQRDPKTV